MNTLTSLHLPGTPEKLPAALAEMQPVVCPPFSGRLTSPLLLRQHIQAQSHTVDCIVGSSETGGLYWLVARAAYPNARVAVECAGANGSSTWFDLNSGEILPWEMPAAQPEAVDADTPEPQAAVKPASVPAPAPVEKAAESPKAQKPSRLAELTDNRLISEAFAKASWGGQNDFLREVRAEAASRQTITRGILNRVNQSIKQGDRAKKAWEEALTLFNQNRQGQGDFDTQFAKLLSSHKSEMVKKFLVRKLEKHREFVKTKRNQSKTPVDVLPTLVLKDGNHPNSLRHQPPQKHWEVLIDETGEAFGAEVEALGTGDSPLGRVVALASPAGFRLPSLKPDFHAAHLHPNEVTKVLKAVFDQPIGVFGFTLKDSASGLNRHWLSAVETLMRWVLRQLPFADVSQDTAAPGAGASVKFFIEQRGDYEPGTSLSVLCRMLSAELVDLDLRYTNIHIEAEFIRKEQHPHNGYVDAIAYTWGSPSDDSKRRLKASRFLGHCLLQPDDVAMERLYLAVDRHLDLEPADWYFLVANLQNEPAGSLAVELAARLGEKVSKELAVWRPYLSHVQMLMQQKRYVLVELAAALEWLQKWQPAQGEMPPLALLNWHSARLACANHFGSTALADARASMALAEDLREEASPDACEADLRVAVAATNAFQFELAANALHHWIGTAPAIPGLKNWCKVQSSLGQHAAFLGEFDDALGYFDAALEGFSRLSDRQAAKRDQQQTQAYRLITRMDQILQNGEKADETLTAELTDYLGTTPDKAAASSFFAQDLKRYQHHVFLRAMMAFPETFERVATRYLGGEAEWSEGKGHPWPLIDAYRAILLASRNKSVSAKTLGQRALDALAQEESPLLRWMHCVLAVALSAAGIPVTWGEAVSLNEFDFSLPNAPLQALTDWSNAVAGEVRYTPAEIMLELGQCLPFNFH